MPLLDYALLGKSHPITVIGQGNCFSRTPSNPWLTLAWRQFTRTTLLAGKCLAKKSLAFSPDCASACLALQEVPDEGLVGHGKPEAGRWHWPRPARMCVFSIPGPAFFAIDPIHHYRSATMNLDRAIFAFAGIMILISVTLAHFVSPWWLLLTVFVGVNLLQSSITGFCPAAIVFSRLGVKSGCAFR